MTRPTRPLDPATRDAARRWIADDVDAASQAELQAVLDAAIAGSAEAISDLDDRMSGALSFGTAGLRGPLRAGPNGMNRAVIIRTTAGLAAWLRERGQAGVVVVGRDARHGSEAFAEDTAGVLAAAGFDVRMLPEPLPTPMLAYTARALGAVAGVQITASHNPPQDNGYKVYLESGALLVSPADTEIERRIAEAPAAVSVPRERSWGIQHTDYLAHVARLPRGSARGLRIAATALHGVGAQPLVRALRGAGFSDVHLVSEQAKPDPDFPTLTFPNPEEPGATDALLALAADIGADLAVALDPDADRCAIGVPTVDGSWRMLSGDETGALLGEHILSTMDRSTHADPFVATTIVSSPMLSAIARAHGVRFDETLTGFKWLVRAGDGAGTGLVYAYEEALGYCVDPDAVRDKDGISAAVLACDLAATRKQSGQSLLDALDELALQHGVHRSGQLSARVSDLSWIAETMRRLRAETPSELGGVPVHSTDLLPESDVLVFTDAEAAETGSPGRLRVVIRPSGTEPKLKCYLQVVHQLPTGLARDQALADATQAADNRLDAVRTAVAHLLGSDRKDAPPAKAPKTS